MMDKEGGVNKDGSWKESTASSYGESRTGSDSVKGGCHCMVPSTWHTRGKTTEREEFRVVSETEVNYKVFVR